MESTHRLKVLLQVQLASDAYAVLHLPFVLEALTKQDLLPSAHTEKWIARVNALIHSKDPAAKWSGLCLAYQTATFSKDIMLEYAHNWVGAAMPLLINQPAPTAKSAVRLLRLVFSSASDVPEFQRQLCIPNVPKFVHALIALVEKEGSPDIHLLAIESLTHIVSLYPSLCRPLHGPLSNIALRYLNGSAPTPTSHEHLDACSRLYAALPLTGGKVNAPNLWRKALDDTIAFAWGALMQLRTTFAQQVPVPVVHSSPSADDPALVVPLALDRLRVALRVIKDLLHAHLSRPVALSLGSLVRLCSTLLQCSTDEEADTHVHVSRVVRSLEVSVIPSIRMLACEMLNAISHAGQHHLTPHLPMLLSHIAYHLEQSQSSVHTLHLLRTVSMLLADGSQLHDNVIASRLARATMPLLAIILSKRSQSKEEQEQGATQGRSKKGKKRGRGYEGDEVFKVGRDVVCLTASDGDVLLASVDVLGSLLYRTPVNTPVHSIATRLFLSIYASLPQMPPTLLSPDRSLHTRLCAKVQRVCIHLTIGTTSTLSKSLGLVLSVSDGQFVNDDVTVAAEIELLLHPRVPPLVRSLPHVETLSLFRAEEGDDEIDVRRRTGLAVPDEPDVAPAAVTEGPTVPVVGQVSTSRSSTDAAKRTGELLLDMQVDSPTPAFGSTPPLQPSHALWSPPPTQSSGVSGQPAHDATGTLSTTRNSSPPPPDLLPSHTVTTGQQPSRIAIPAVTPGPTPKGEEDDDDEPMPPIDLSSDSDSE